MATLKNKFVAAAVGRDGGSSVRSGFDRAETSIRHEGVGGAVDVTGYLRDGDGVPCVQVRAWDDAFRREGLGDRSRVLYDGPLADAVGLDDGTRTGRIADACRAELALGMAGAEPSDTKKDPDLCACPSCEELACAGHGSDDPDGYLYCAECELVGCSERCGRCEVEI